MRFGFDDNLGIPAGFADHVGVEPVSFHDLDDLLDDFERGRVDVMFAPAGALPYLGEGYGVLAQATHGPEQQTTLQSNLVVPTASDVLDPVDVVGRRLGMINRCCTTSYWAPMIVLQPLTPAGTRLDWVPAAGFDDLLVEVVDGRSEAAMVWDAVLDANATTAGGTREVIGHGALPTPLVLAGRGVGEAARDRLRGDIATFAGADRSAFFPRFVAADLDAVDAFVDRMRAARRHFGC